MTHYVNQYLLYPLYINKDKNLYLVETISIFRQRYVVEAKESEHAADHVVVNTTGSYDENFREFSQKHIDETITSVRKIKEKEYLRLFNEDNDYLKSWDNQKKLDKWITKWDIKSFPQSKRKFEWQAQQSSNLKSSLLF